MARDLGGVNPEFEAFRLPALFQLLTMSPISDTVASFLADGVFMRFPAPYDWEGSWSARPDDSVRGYEAQLEDNPNGGDPQKTSCRFAFRICRGKQSQIASTSR